MLSHFFHPTRTTDRAPRDELQSLCLAAQIENLALSRHLARDVGLDCGCALPASPHPSNPYV